MKKFALAALLMILAVGHPASVRASTVAGLCAHAATTAALRELTVLHGITGAAIEVDGPRCGRWSNASGLADLQTSRPMTADGRVRIGSTTKTFTATVVLQLAAEQRIGLDTTVEHYLPGVVHGNGYDGSRITVRDLLRHTSGLPDHVDALPWDSFAQWRYRTFTPGELVGMALAQPHPSREWTYSTTNYVLAAMIVERVTGHRVGSEITERVIRPLGLRNTYWPGDSPFIRGTHPRGYWNGVDVTELSVSWGGAGGALISTLHDENLFFAALLSGRLLPPAYLRQMTATVPADPDRIWPGARYGLGLINTPMQHCGTTTMWGHGGTLPGFETVGAITRDGRRAQLVITSNTRSQESWEALHNTLEVALCDA